MAFFTPAFFGCTRGRRGPLGLVVLLLLLVGQQPTAAAVSPPGLQSEAVDSLRQLLAQPQPDTVRVMLLCQLSDQLWTQHTDSAAVYARKALLVARRIGYRHGEGEALNRLGAALRESNLARALELFQQSLRLAEATHDQRLMAQNMRSIGIIYVYLRDKRQGLAPVAVVPQDLSRMLINLFTNAFQAVQQRQRQRPDPAYRPEVTVTTRCGAKKVEIRICDNGTGISAQVKEQIFQPFFTTKSVGEGTGLGLSPSYDIVTSGHGGTLTVESQEGQGVEFIIILPT